MSAETSHYPSILIITGRPLSMTSNIGKTIASLFEGYPEDRIAQLYFHREAPSSPVCSNYFRISDEDVFRFVTRRQRHLGQIVQRGDMATRVLPERANNIIKRSRAAQIIRTFLWLGVRWEGQHVREWLDRVKPDIIFFCGGDDNYLYGNVLRLSKRCGAKIVYFITDDHILPYRGMNPMDAAYRAWTRNLFRKTSQRSALVLTIGDKMSGVYRSRFGTTSKSVMNLVEISDVAPLNPTTIRRNHLKFAYVGGLHTGRGKVLAALAASLERVAEAGLHGELNVYSPTPPSPSELLQLERPPFSAYRGGLDAAGVAAVLRESDVVVHVEDDTVASKRKTFLSISTKIPEYMASGTPILAIGPQDVASIEYLAETSSGLVITSTAPDELDSGLTKLFSDPQGRIARAENARAVVWANHDAARVRKELHETLVKL